MVPLSSSIPNVPPHLDANAVLSDRQICELICELCQLFYSLGWVTGTGGGISIRKENAIFMAPSGVQKERIGVDDIFVLDREGKICKQPEKPLKVSACHPLFMHAFRKRNAGAVIHSHSMNAMLVTLIYPEAFRIANLEMLKGIVGVGAFDTHEIPIIDNTPHESELSDSLEQAIDAYPQAQGVLVRGHGVYVWGKDWIQAKTQIECYDYLFAAALRIRELGLNPATGGQSRP